MKNYILLAFLGLLCCTACDKAEQIPAYIRIEPFVINEQDGAALHDLREAWIYVGNEFLGAYTLPGEVPVLGEGSLEIEIFPGVTENGILNTPGLYLPFDSYITSVDLTPGKTTTVTPRTSYRNTTTVPFGGEEDFEGGNIIPFVNFDFDTSNFLKIIDDGPFGSFMRLDVDEAKPINSVAMDEFMENIPKSGGQEVWLELHHKNDVPMRLTLLSSNAQNPGDVLPQTVFTFNPSAEWNKIYLNLTQFVTAAPLEDDLYGLALTAFLPVDANGEYVFTAGTVSIDNLKVIHF